MAAKTGAEIASAYVTLQIAMPGVKNDVRKYLGGVDMSSIGGQMGSRLADGIKKSLKYSAAAVGGVLAAGIGASLVKGFSRLNSIDQATAKLRGLGNSASEVDKIMANALASVKGTAFGLDSAATTAAGAVAAGIKPGKELEGVLKSVANSAAASGSGMDEMGSIYNKVASLGKAQNDSLQQVADRGLPIYQALATQMGVTTDEVFKMASAGKIGFKDFETAMTTAAGTVASEMGNTVSGSWANFMSSLGRIGAGALGGVWSSLAPVLQATTNALGPLETIAASVGEKIGKFLAPAIEWLITSLNNGVDFSMFTPLGLIFEALAPVLPVVSDALQQVAGVIGGALAKVLPALMPPLLQLVEIFAGALGNLLPVLAQLFGVVADAVLTLLKPVLPLVNVLVGALAPIMNALSPIIVILANALTPLIALIADLLTPVIGFLAEALTWVVGIITTAVTNAVPWLGQAFQNVWAVIKPVVDWFGQAFKWLWETILSPVFTAIRLGIAIVGGVIQGVYLTFIKPIVNLIGSGFKWLWANVISPVVNWIKEKWELLGLATQYMWVTYIQPAFQAIGDALNWIWVNVISPVVDWIREKWELLGLGTRMMYEQYIKPAWDAVSAVISNVWNTVKGVIDTMVRVITSDPKKAFEAARDAIGTAWKGIQDLAKKPVKFVVETVINGLIDTINMIPGVNIPKVKLPKGFRVGGYTGDVGVDTAAGIVHGREFVTRAESTSKIMRNHPGVLEHMNRYGEIPGYRKGGLVNPLPAGSYSVSQPWGNAGHNGIDLAAPMGTPVFAAGDGVVGLAGSVNMGGNEVYIQHTNGLGTRYSHLSRFATQAGTPVKAGQRVGYVGSTGMSTGPHLHYMVHAPGGGAGNYGNHVNPAPYMGLFGKDLGDSGGLLDGLIDWAASQVKGAFPEGGMWVDAAAGLAKEAAKTAIDVFMPKIGTDAGTTLYDNGGWLQPGVSLVENKTGRPEHILTDSQWDAIAADRDGSRGPVTVFIGDRQFEGWMDDRADAAVDRGFEDQAAAGRFAAYV
ncbi:peptidoglycan DD-metalloendopeptidase family protein [Leucobacter luti]|uniref:Tape measure domain-containing protein n=1 Tax=Leucobacter luti TaxID=340320 RepID=A0A4Q7U004_9MICO|nr:peptidoglycan DD-metalloendopeptidase family protein [Leucobacter luti]MBL3699230.1 hypothetical protein [Leucobacter luti]RZT66731.1 tape measure domain-containing protein [Leucobacter luti]